MDLLIQELMKFLPAGQILTLVLLIWLLAKMTKMSDTLIELNTWRTEHEKADKDRFEQISEWMNRRGDG